MTNNESSTNFIVNLFDWRIKKLLALQYFKAIYLFCLIFITLGVIILEFYIARYLEVSILLKFLVGVGTILGSFILILIIRIMYEFYFAFFYIEEHLRDIRRKT